MSSINLRRRQILKSLGLVGVTAGTVGIWQWSARYEKRRHWYLSAANNESDSHGVGWIKSGESNHRHTLSGFRGHSVVQHPLHPEKALMLGRRPATESVEVDLRTGQLQQRFHAQAGRHFYGHACFSNDGSLLFTTENDLSSQTGVIVVRESETYRVLGDMPSYGVGPHQIHLMPDAQTLVVANGGILTHPSSGRKKLNLDTMQSSLAYVDSEAGDLIAAHTIDEPKSSIRHIDVAADGTVALALQVQRSAMNHTKLVALGGVHSLGGSIRLFEGPTAVLQRMHDYVGSVAINAAAGTAAFTSPRGNLAAFWHIDDGRFGGYYQLFDVCGVTVTHDQRFFALSNSQGHIRHVDSRTLVEDESRRLHIAGLRLDNHLSLAQL